MPTKSYWFSRLAFRREVIEKLSAGERFRVETPEGIFQFTREEFEREFPKVIKSKSYREDGLYHYPKTPRRALAYLNPTDPAPKPSKKHGGRYSAPAYVLKAVDQKLYADWLHKKAATHARRDSKRWKVQISIASYKEAIHNAVWDGDGADSYTGEPLAWNLIGLYSNEASKRAGSKYKRRFRLLPTLDHLDTKPAAKPRFQICSWEVNDAKSDLPHRSFVALCHKVAGRFAPPEA